MVSASMKKILPTEETNSQNGKSVPEPTSASPCTELPLPKTIQYFNAFFDIHRTSHFTPLNLCYQLLRFPVYCMIIQIWIHIEAFNLFAKGVEFIPHPEGAETAASVAIGHVMAPFFLVKDWLANARSDDSNRPKID